MKHLLVFACSVLTLSLFAQSPKKAIRKLGNDPVFFIDSVNVDEEEFGRKKF